jgi:hypothetical protein
MKKIMHLNRACLLCCALAWLSACAQKDTSTFEHIERYETGQISRRVNIVKGKKEGIMTDYYNDGSLMAERNFVGGVQEGRTVIFYPGGQIKEAQYFENGKKQRGDTLWYENGKVQFATTFQDDKKHGYLRKWNPEGELIYEAKFDLDTLLEVNGNKIDSDNQSAKPTPLKKSGTSQF